ncbi:unnamed protein product [Prunus armeniaca]
MLPSLLELHLSNCFFESVPLSLKKINFTSLSVLDLSYNSFTTSSFPSWLFNLTNLRKLDLSSTFFGGPLPDELASLKSLEYLDLSDLGLKGRIARVIGNMCKLKFLSLSFGKKNYGEKIEEIWRSWSNCPNNTIALESLDFSDCGLEGQLPASLGMLTSLQHLDLSRLLLWGSIPESIGNLLSFKTLDLSSSNLKSSIPKSLGKLSQLVELDLSNNSWEGILTEAHFINLTNLKDISIFNSYREMPMSLLLNVAYDWVPPFKLHRLSIGGCRVGHGFGALIQSQTELVDVFLCSTFISDSIEEWLSKISSRVEYLDLSDNNFSGRLPLQLKFPKLRSIRLGHNQLEGPLPLWPTNASCLDLQSNLFSGSIPSNLDQLMPYLGTISKCLTCLVEDSDRCHTSMWFESYYGKTTIMSKGKELEYKDYQLTAWGDMIDLSSNNFEGEIPEQVGNMVNLSMLNLSMNRLTGEIPSSIGKLHWLETLDLSHNHSCPTTT